MYNNALKNSLFSSVKVNMKLTESKIKRAAASKYMNADQLEFFKERLINQ